MPGAGRRMRRRNASRRDIREEGRIEPRLEFERHGTGHHHHIVTLPPQDVEIAAGQGNPRSPVVRPRRAAATRAAQAAEPQARVRPTPRSQTLSSM